MEASFRNTAEMLQWIATSFWILDIPMSFLTAVFVNDNVQCRLVDIAKSYLSTWFTFDLIMLVPDLVVVILQSSGDQPTGVLRLVRFRRMMRLLRFFQIIRLWRIVEGFNFVESRLTILRTQFGSLIRPVLHVLILMAVSVHVLGSLWFAAGHVEGGWVMEEGLQELSLGRQYTRSIEWALSRLPPSALRFNVELHTPSERWLGIAGTCAALICSSIFVSFVTNTMANVARERMRTTKILQSVRKYCATHCISYSYTMQMKRYVEREHRRNELCNHMPLLQTLPEGMVRELFQEARGPTLHSHAFFKEVGSTDPSMELNLCSQAVTEFYLLAGDTVFDMTRKTEGMYFMASGVSIYFYWSSEQPRMTRRRSSRRNTTGSLFKGMMPSSMSSSVPPSRSRSKVTMAQTVLEAGEYIAEAALWVKAWRHQGQLQSMVATWRATGWVVPFLYVVSGIAFMLSKTGILKYEFRLFLVLVIGTAANAVAEMVKGKDPVARPGWTMYQMAYVAVIMIVSALVVPIKEVLKWRAENPRAATPWRLRIIAALYGLLTTASLVLFIGGFSFMTDGESLRQSGAGGATVLLEAPMFLSRTFGLFFLVSLTACWGYCSSAGWVLILLSYATHAMIPYNKGGHPLSPDLFLIGMVTYEWPLKYKTQVASTLRSYWPVILAVILLCSMPQVSGRCDLHPMHTTWERCRFRFVEAVLVTGLITGAFRADDPHGITPWMNLWSLYAYCFHVAWARILPRPYGAAVTYGSIPLFYICHKMRRRRHLAEPETELGSRPCEGTEEVPTPESNDEAAVTP
eukprot:s138_g36.t1